MNLDTFFFVKISIKLELNLSFKIKWLSNKLCSAILYE